MLLEQDKWSSNNNNTPTSTTTTSSSGGTDSLSGELTCWSFHLPALSGDPINALYFFLQAMLMPLLLMTL